MTSLYLDHGATSFPKPESVTKAVAWALEHCTSPGRGGYIEAMEGAQRVYGCRRAAAEMFDCSIEQVVFTSGCTQSLNMAIRTLFHPGDRVVVSGFEHNAVMRPLSERKVKILTAGNCLFSWENMLEEFEKILQSGVQGAVFTHVSNVFGYILPAEKMAVLCRNYQVPFIIDGAQSAGILPVSLRKLGADFIAIPGHKGLHGPMGTGILLCGTIPEPFIAGGTGSESESLQMPDFLPERGEAGTLNVPGICGLEAGIRWVMEKGVSHILAHEKEILRECTEILKGKNYRVFTGEPQGGVLSFIPPQDCEAYADALARKGIAVRAGLHCAPLAHRTAGTLKTGTVRMSFGPDTSEETVKKLGEIL